MLRQFDADAVRTALTWPRLFAALDRALTSEIAAPLRTGHAIAVPNAPDATLLMMPAWRVGSRLGVKLVTVFPGNNARGERSVSAVYLLFDANDGRPLALFDGEAITARRTAAASAYAARKLARADSRHLVIVGAGRQAHGLVDAYRSILPIERVTVWSRTSIHADAFVGELREGGVTAVACSDLEHAVRDADVVSCATLSTEPLVRGAWLKAGTHLDLVGAFRRHMRETDDEAIARADLIVVDSRAGALSEGGDLVQAIESGAIEAARVAADLADLARGSHPGRTRDDQVTVFKSVGFALEDLAAAEAVFDCAAA